ncbi:MAG: LysR family transcriptional regulator, partial [Frankia sp.]|nr:LysR family transcriptional regulator [Frankia sp.]
MSGLTWVVLDTWTLRVLVEVARQGSFSGAAEALSMTQPAVSRQVAGLERRTGAALFVRRSRGVSLTAAGELAVGQAREVLARLDALEASLAAYRSLDGGRLRLSAFAGANTAFVPEAVRRFSRDFPAVDVSLTVVDWTRRLEAVRTGEVDVALVTAWDLHADPMAAKYQGVSDPLPPAATAGLDLLPLLDEDLHVALPAGHRLAGNELVRLADLRDEVWIEGGHPDCLGPIPLLSEALGGPPRIGFVCEDWNGKQALVAGGAGVTLVPTLAQTGLRSDVVLRRTVPRLPPRRLFAVSLTGTFRPPAVAIMLDVLTALAAEHRS